MPIDLHLLLLFPLIFSFAFTFGFSFLLVFAFVFHISRFCSIDTKHILIYLISQVQERLLLLIITTKEKTFLSFSRRSFGEVTGIEVGSPVTSCTKLKGARSRVNSELCCREMYSGNV